MTRPRGTDAAGQPLDLIGQPLGIRHAPPPQPYIQEEPTMAKAPENGVYIDATGRYIVRKGDVIPDGAEFEALDTNAPDEEQVAEERALDSAPENKAQQSAPQNRAKKVE